MPDKQEKKIEENDSIPSIRTLKTDAQIYIRDKKLSSLDIAQAQYTRTTHTEETTEMKSHQKFVVIGVFILLTLVLGFITYRWILPAPAKPEMIISSIPRPFIHTEGEHIIEFRKSDQGMFFRKLQAERDKILRFGSLYYFPIKIIEENTNDFLGASDFIKLAQWSPPSAFVDSLAEDFNLYLYHGSLSRDIAFIFQTKNFEQAFAGLLAWESTMIQNLRTFLVPNAAIPALFRPFEDTILQNNDTRMFRDDNSAFLLGYAIFDKRFIVLGTSRESISEVLKRLIALPPR